MKREWFIQCDKVESIKDDCNVDKKYRCTKCKATFETDAKLQEHRYSKTFKCGNCLKTYVSEWYYIKHMRTCSMGDNSKLEVVPICPVHNLKLCICRLVNKCNDRK